MNPPPTILWLASWYPTKLDPFPGDFIQRRAKALSLHVPVQVLHVIKDAKGIITQKVKIEQQITGLLTETIIYYCPLKTGISILDKVISSVQFYRLGRQQINKIHKENRGKNILVDVHVAMKAGVIALWMKRKWKTSFCLTEHWAGYYKELMPPDLQRSAAFWKITKKIFTEAVFFRPETINLGEHINKELCKIQYRVIPNVVETSVFNFDKSVQKPSTFTFVHVSTLGHQKNIIGILNVLDKLTTLSNAPSFQLRLVGPAPAEIVALVNDSPHLKNVVSFSGPIPYYQVATELKKAHAMLMFSRYENLPCVILEALCCGLPVISTIVGGIDEHLDAKNGILLKSEDENALEDAIIRMVVQYKTYNPAEISAQATAKYNYQTVGRMLLANYKEFYPQYF